MSRQLSAEVLAIAAQSIEHGLIIHPQMDAILDSSDIRERLNIGPTAFVTSLFSGSRIGYNPARGITAQFVTNKIANSGHIITLSGGGTYKGNAPVIGETGIMGHIAYAMCKNDNGHFVITEGLIRNEGMPPQRGQCLCLIETGGSIRLVERENGLIAPADAIVVFSGAVGTPSEALTAITTTAIASGKSEFDRANHRTIIVIDMPHEGVKFGYGEHQGLITTVRNAIYSGYMYNTNQMNNTVLVYQPKHYFTDKLIAEDIQSLLVLAHYRAAHISPHLVEPIATDVIRKNLKPLMGRVYPIGAHRLDHEIMDLEGWEPYIRQLDKITRKPLIVKLDIHNARSVA